MSPKTMTRTKDLSGLVALLPENQQDLVFNLVINLLPDDIATEDDLKAIAEARAEYERGECINLEEFLMQLNE